MNRSIKIIPAMFAVTMLALSSCNIVSKNDTKGLNDIMAFFGGRCNFLKDYDYSTDKGKEVTAKIELRGSTVVQDFADKPGLCASGAAYMFYNDLGSEKKNINSVQVTLNYNDGSKTINTYTAALLDSVINGLATVDKVVQFLKESKYDSVCSMFITDTSVVKLNRSLFISQVQKLDSTLGAIKDFHLLGFKIDRSDNYTSIYYAGGLTRTIQGSKFAVGIVLNKGKNLLRLVDYTF